VNGTFVPFLNVGDLVRLSLVCKDLYSLYHPLVHSKFTYPFTSGKVVAHCRFDQAEDQASGECVDISGRAHGGELRGGHYCEGGHGVSLNYPDRSAAELGRAEYVLVRGEVRELDPEAHTEFTVEAWVHPYMIDPREYANPVVSKHDGGSGWELRLSPSGPTFMITMGYGNHQEIFPQSKVEPRWYWTHIAGTYDGENTLKLYQDRVCCSTKLFTFSSHFYTPRFPQVRAPPAPYNSGGALTLGKCSGVPNETFRFTSCEIAEVRITKKVLSPDEFLPYPLFHPTQ